MGGLQSPACPAVHSREMGGGAAILSADGECSKGDAVVAAGLRRKLVARRCWEMLNVEF